MKSQVVPLGSTAPDFTLPDLDGLPHRLADRLGRYALVLFYRGHW